MAIAKMKRLELVALQSDRETLMEALLRLGCVEIREPEEQPELLHRQSSSLAERQSDLRRLTAALDALSRAAPEKTPLLAARPQISEKAFLDEKATCPPCSPSPTRSPAVCAASASWSRA